MLNYKNDKERNLAKDEGTHINHDFAFVIRFIPSVKRHGVFHTEKESLQE